MSKIDDLIAKLCPNGVEYKTLGNCITKNIGGGTPSRSNPDYWDGDILWASVGDLSVPGKFIHTTRAKITSEGLKNSPSNIISRGDVIVAVKISPGKMKIAAEDIAINQDLRGLSLYEFIDNSFLIYYFQTISIIGNGTIVKGITTETLERICIPVPPLEIQREIVNVLDTFTKLEAELEAELEARRRQYNYYRDQLLNFEGRDDVQWVTLGEVATFKYGYTAKALDSGFLRFIRITDITPEGKLSSCNAKYIKSNEDCLNYLVKKGDILMARTGATYGKTLLINENISAVYASFLICIKTNNSIMLPDYYWHFAQSNFYWKQVNSMVSMGGQPQFNANVLKNIHIPVPPLEEQTRIVAILDKFDALVNDLSSGLPAEIAARRKQYEYYRDRLLTFKEAQ